ncbi:MAG: histidine phosphatase family protein, partial [Vulcanimicrobiaceae bacterium]
PERRPAALRAELAALAARAMRAGSWSELPGTESSHDVCARIEAALGEIARRHAGERIAIVSHAGTINAYLASVLGIARDFFFPTGNASISLVRLVGEERIVLRLNDTAHLERAALRH